MDFLWLWLCVAIISGLYDQCNDNQSENFITGFAKIFLFVAYMIYMIAYLAIMVLIGIPMYLVGLGDLFNRLIEKLDITKKNKEKAKYEPIGQYIFTALILAATAGTAGFALGAISFELSEKGSEIVGWIAAIGTFSLSYNLKWNLI